MSHSKSYSYSQLCETMKNLKTGVWITDLANLSALLFESLPEVNWAGFYLIHQGELWLGPFQGKVACTRIALNQGVCGLAATQRKVILVPDVHEFAGHIVCDTNSRSEIVVPLIVQGELIGVLDIDSPKLARFDQEDAAGLQELVDTILLGAMVPPPSDSTPVSEPRQI